MIQKILFPLSKTIFFIYFFTIIPAGLIAEENGLKLRYIEIQGGYGSIPLHTDDSLNTGLSFLKWNRFRTSFDQLPVAYEILQYENQKSHIDSSRFRIGLIGATTERYLELGFGILVGRSKANGLMDNHSLLYEELLFLSGSTNFYYPSQNERNPLESYLVSRRTSMRMGNSIAPVFDIIIAPQFKAVNPYARISVPILYFISSAAPIDGLGLSVGVRLFPDYPVGINLEYYSEIYEFDKISGYFEKDRTMRSEQGARGGIQIRYSDQ